MKLSRSRIALPLLAFLSGATFLHADILIMKNGSKMEGTILSESPTAVRMKYRLTPKIWDEKDFPRTDIQEIIKQTPQELELIELKKLLPTPDLYPADKYEQTIQDRLRPFVNKYPGTPEAGEVEKMIETLQEEKKRVSNGELKLEGRWLTTSEAKGEQYNIEAYQLLKEMRAEMANNEWEAAMRIFDKFVKNRPSYVGSTYYPAAIAEAIICLEKLEPIYTKMAAEQPALLKKQTEDLAKLGDEDKRKTKAAIDVERNRWRADAEAQRRNGVRWMEPYKYDSQSISTAQRLVTSESARLRAMNLDDVKARSEAFVAVYRKIGEGDYQGGSAAFQRIQSFGTVNEYRDIVADQKTKLLALYNDLLRKNAAGQMATSGSSALGGSTSAGVDDRVAQILAEANGTAQPQAAAPAPGTPGAAALAPGMTAPGAVAQPVAPGAVPQQPGVAPQAVAARPGAPGAPAAYPPAIQQPTAQAPYPAPAQAPVAMQPPAEESNTQTFIMIGMGVLLVLFGFLAFKKKKAE